jgi:hypothetical protein
MHKNLFICLSFAPEVSISGTQTNANAKTEGSLLSSTDRLPVEIMLGIFVNHSLPQSEGIQTHADSIRGEVESSKMSGDPRRIAFANFSIFFLSHT